MHPAAEERQAGREAARDQALPVPPGPVPLSLYVHLPWCVRKCPYCDFNSHVPRGELPEQAYTAALLRDLDFELAGLSAPPPLASLFIGGGTPSLFRPGSIAALLEGVRDRLATTAGMEVTLEANPGASEAKRFRGFRDAGVNRLSVGVQSFDDRLLRRIGRIHGGAQARRAVDDAVRAGFDSVNLDLMFGLPGQEPDDALADLAQALDTGVQHVSLYQLTLEPGTAFYRRPPPLPDDDAAWEMEQALHERLAAAGYERYEVSAFARPGHRCAHNLNYWTFGDYLGIGAGAHGKVSGPRGVVRRARVAGPQAWMAAAGDGDAVAQTRWLETADLRVEFLLNALRLPGGCPLRWLVERTGLGPAELEPGLSRARATGMLEPGTEYLRPTPGGLLHLNDLLAQFVP